MPDAGPPRSVYVHVPFCAKRCHYCDFSVARAATPPLDAYFDALARDLDAWFEEYGWAEPVRVETLFIGGGTPSLLGPDGMRRLAALLRTRFTWDPARVEWTAEANPNSLTDEVCAAWRELGVNRLSIGVQSFQDGPLAWLGRLHDAAEAASAVERAGAAGFERINVDLIFGLPDDVPRDWGSDVARALELGVTHVSAYGLTAEPRTPLGRLVDLGRVRMPGDRRYGDEYLEVAGVLARAGYEHYEVSNFARPGHASVHNWHYWDGSEYLGLGPSAHSYLCGERIWNVHRWDRYRRAAETRDTLREGRERPDSAARRLERIWLGLRTRAGVPWAEVGPVGHEAKLASWRDEGWIAPDGAALRLTPAGWLRLDPIAAEVAGWTDASIRDESQELQGNRA
ncbi:MAG: radical SAM family heme chaperone HemW [Gemmatimonadales bacterium]|jgi:oxygen-independent coproporphyrinogen-3 oxidase